MSKSHVFTILSGVAFDVWSGDEEAVTLYDPSFPKRRSLGSSWMPVTSILRLTFSARLLENVMDI